MLIDYSECRKLILLVHNKEPANVVHVGAHVGEEIAAYHANGIQHITWFEANPTLIPELQKSVAKYPVSQQVINCALWDSNKKIRFNITNNLQSSSAYEIATHAHHYPNIVVTESRLIDAYRFDSIIESGVVQIPTIDFVNVDTQGAELAILKGFGKNLASSSILGIYLEVNKEPLYKGIPLIDEIDTFLMQEGFVRILTKWTNAGWGDAFYLKQRVES